MSKYISLDYLESCIHSISDPSGKYYVLRIIDEDDIHNAKGDCVIEVNTEKGDKIMDYEEKREIKKQISQLLADAGLNQGRLKEIVEEEIRHKVNRAIDQTLASLDAQSRSGSYIIDTVNSYFSGTNNSRIWYNIESAVKEELKKRVINVTLQKVDINKED